MKLAVSAWKQAWMPTAAPPNPVAAESSVIAECRSCGVRVSFLPGYEPRLRGWDGDTCLSCRMIDLQAEVLKMSDAERRALVRHEIEADPRATVDDLHRRTGVMKQVCAKVSDRAVTDGIALPQAAVYAERRRERQCRIAATLREDPARTDEEVARQVGADVKEVKQRRKALDLGGKPKERKRRSRGEQSRARVH